jgi:outer membrane protein
MNKKIIIFFAVQAALIISLGTIVLLRSGGDTRTAYIEVAKVYDAFKMKKELEGKFTTVELFRKSVLDSLELNLQLLSVEFDKTKCEETKTTFLQKKQEYLGIKKQYEEDNAAASQQYTEQIFTQLNQYITEYGKEHGYKYIFGAEGSGSLMYANDSENITEEITTYVNDQYKGIN